MRYKKVVLVLGYALYQSCFRILSLQKKAAQPVSCIQGSFEPVSFRSCKVSHKQETGRALFLVSKIFGSGSRPNVSHYGTSDPNDPNKQVVSNFSAHSQLPPLLFPNLVIHNKLWVSGSIEIKLTDSTEKKVINEYRLFILIRLLQGTKKL